MLIYGLFQKGRVLAQDGVPEPGLPEFLFETPLIGGSNTRYHYDVSADGERFVAIVPIEDAATTPIHVVLDWMSDDKP